MVLLRICNLNQNVTLNRDNLGLEDFQVKWEKLDHQWVQADKETDGDMDCYSVVIKD